MQQDRQHSGTRGRHLSQDKAPRRDGRGCGGLGGGKHSGRGDVWRESDDSLTWLLKNRYHLRLAQVGR